MRREGKKTKKREGAVPAVLKAAPVTVCSAAHFLGMLVRWKFIESLRAQLHTYIGHDSPIERRKKKATFSNDHLSVPAGCAHLIKFMFDYTAAR